LEEAAVLFEKAGETEEARTTREVLKEIREAAREPQYTM